MNHDWGQRELPVSSTIADLQSRGKDAAFRDTHDSTEFPHETEPVRPRVRKSVSEGLTVRLDQDNRRELESRAAEQRFGP